MATLTFTKAADNLTVTVTDTTVYSSPSRATCGVYVNVYKTDYDGAQTALTLTLDNDDPNTTASWTFDLDTDGWFQAYYVAPPDYNVGTTYAAYAAVFDPSNNLVYRSKSAGNVGNALLNITYWEPIPDPAALAANDGLAVESLNTDTAIFNEIFTVQATELRDRQAVVSAVEGCSDCVRGTDIDLFELLDLMVVGMEKAAILNEFAQGERIARRAEALSEYC